MTEGGRSDPSRVTATTIDANRPRSINWELVDYMRENGSTLGELAYIHGIPLDELRKRYQVADDE
jgi:hypothetical protein